MVWASISGIVALLLAILKYFPAKNPEEKKVEERKDAVAKIEKQTQDARRTRDTSKLGDFD